MKPRLIFTALLLCTYAAIAQVEYYSTNGLYTFSRATLDEMVRELQDNYTTSYGRDMYAGVSIVKTRVSGDSIIHTVTFDVSANPPSELIQRQGLAKLVGTPLPLGLLETLKGEDFMIKSLIGKPSLITFWGTRDVASTDELPVLNKIRQQYGDKVNFIAMTPENAEAVRTFLKTHRFRYTHITGAQAFMDQLGIDELPTTLFLDSRGIIRAVENGVPHHLNMQTGEMSLGDGKEFIAVLESLQ